MKHVYWAVTCKTPECGAMLLPDGCYLGTVEDTETKIKPEFQPPEFVELRCSFCGKTHTYTPPDFGVVQTDELFEPPA